MAGFSPGDLSRSLGSVSVLEVSDLHASHAGVEILRGLSLVLAGGSSCAVMGPSGSGKSTLLSCILGMHRTDAGAVRVAGESVASASGRGLARIRRELIGVVFQQGELLGDLDPVENVAVPVLLAGRRPGDAYALAESLLGRLRVPFAARPVGEFSGGERQRIAVARALVNEPALMLADEPTGSLDLENRDEVADLLFDLPRTSGCGLLVVTHDPQIAGRAEMVWHLHEGRLVEREAAGR